MNEDSVRQLQERAARLAALTQHPSYKEWRDEMERRIERDHKRLLAEMLSGKPADQRDLDYTRGFWAGMRYALTVPDKAEDTLTRALRQREGAASA